jgi:hypothetical protein
VPLATPPIPPSPVIPMYLPSVIIEHASSQIRKEISAKSEFRSGYL